MTTTTTTTSTFTRRIPKRALQRKIMPFGKECHQHISGIIIENPSSYMELCDSNGEYESDRKRKILEQQKQNKEDTPLTTRFGRRDGDDVEMPFLKLATTTNPYHQVHNPEYRKSLESKKTFLRIENLSDSIDEMELYAIFNRYGPIQIIYLPRDRDQNKKGFAIIGHVHAHDATVAIENMYRAPWKNQILHLELIQYPI